MSFWAMMCPKCGKAMCFYSEKFKVGDLMLSKRVTLPTGEHPVRNSDIRCFHCGDMPGQKPVQKEIL